MQDDPFFTGAYQIEKRLEQSAYSVLGLGKMLETGLPVMLRLWFTAHATTTAAQERIQAEVAALQQVPHPHLLPLLEVRASARGVFLVSVQASFGSLHERLQQPLLTPLPFSGPLQPTQQPDRLCQPPPATNPLFHTLLEVTQPTLPPHQTHTP